MSFLKIFRGLTDKSGLLAGTDTCITDTRQRVLNVGGGNKSILIPDHFANWEHLLLDIKARPDVDLAMDARNLANTQAKVFDAVYCSHNLEHYYPHDVLVVLAGFGHILKPDGFAEIHVPDVQEVMRHVVDTAMDINDTLYTLENGVSISAHDVIYGWGQQIATSGEDFYAHKTGFSKKSLEACLMNSGFIELWWNESPGSFALGVIAFKQPSTESQRSALGFPKRMRHQNRPSSPPPLPRARH